MMNKLIDKIKELKIEHLIKQIVAQIMQYNENVTDESLSVMPSGETLERHMLVNIPYLLEMERTKEMMKFLLVVLGITSGYFVHHSVHNFQWIYFWLLVLNALGLAIILSYYETIREVHDEEVSKIALDIIVEELTGNDTI